MSHPSRRFPFVPIASLYPGSAEPIGAGKDPMYVPGPYESRLLADIDENEHSLNRRLAVRPGTRSTQADHPSAPACADAAEAAERAGGVR